MSIILRRIVKTQTQTCSFNEHIKKNLNSCTFVPTGLHPFFNTW